MSISDTPAKSNPPSAPPTGARTVSALIFAQASKTPEAVAIAAPGRSPLHFGELRSRITTLAAAFNAAGIQRNSRVALVLPNGPDMATAFLAVAYCATCVPLNPGYTAEQFEFFLDDLQARTLIVPAGSNSPARAVARRLGIQIIEISSEPNAPAGLFTLNGANGLTAQREPGLASADDIALVLYTSGTTAVPKQVPLTHANLCASAYHIATTLQLSAADRCLNVLPLFHIHGLAAAVLASLAAGGSVACTPGFADDRFFAWMDELTPTWYTSVPTIHQAILAGAHAHRDIIRRKPLRFIRSASAALPPLVSKGLEDCFNAPVIEAYGMTEAAHQIASNPLPPGLRKPKSVGLTAGAEVAIMDDAAHLLPAGETGEIVIRGDNVTAGYTNNPKANATAFAGGWFHTGDQGFIDPEGYVYLTGRLKEIINRGGEKVSPREIDDALLEHPAVSQAVAFRVLHATLGDDVAAAVVLKDGAQATADEIRAFLFGRLAEYKIPSQLVIIEEIPTGGTGKIDRIRLDAALAERLKPAFLAPRDPTEVRVAAIFSEVLEIGAIGVNDNFFALGGDSLRGFQVLARIRTQLQADVSILELFKGPSVEQLAREVVRVRGIDEVLALERILSDVERVSDHEASRRLHVDASRK
jgi:acyl-CoA synthetase (AMP-forming)/AMP-acid ligase II